jgi:peptidoglycan-associated lipoprotein
MNTKRTFLGFVLAIAVASCSTTKLDDAAAPDKQLQAADPRGRPAASTESQVAPVSAEQAPAAFVGPTGVSRIVYFEYDSYVLKPEFQALVEAHARFLKANDRNRISIEGHTDERGGREYNLALGQRRSEAVRRALGLLGVTDNRIEAISFGEEKPDRPGHEEAAWSRNRRAEIVYR